MTKKELKTLIKECLKEMLFEEKGVLSNVINEVLQSQASSGGTRSVMKENKDETREMILKMKNAGKSLFAPPEPDNLTPVPKSLTTNKNPVVKTISESFGGMNPFEDITMLND